MSETKTCFVISPIGEEGSDTRNRADKVLKYIIKPAVERCGYKATRADQIDNPGIITTQIIQRVIDDDLVVADLTGWNPNVFYELAIRHVAKKPIVQIIEKNQSLPFDVFNVRTVKMDLHVDSAEQAKDEIIEQIRRMESNPEDLETPVSIAVDLKQLKRSKGLEKYLPLYFDLMKKSIESHLDTVNSTQKLMRSTMEMNEDTRKILRKFDKRPRGLPTSLRGPLAALPHRIPDDD